MAQVTIYTTPSCVYCKMAKDFFKKNKVSYAEKDVLSDLTARDEMIKKSHQLGVPVIEVDGNVLVGFDQLRLKEMLGMR